jgi:hypothetical protein
LNPTNGTKRENAKEKLTMLIVPITNAYYLGILIYLSTMSTVVNSQSLDCGFKPR